MSETETTSRTDTGSAQTAGSSSYIGTRSGVPQKAWDAIQRNTSSESAAAAPYKTGARRTSRARVLCVRAWRGTPIRCTGTAPAPAIVRTADIAAKGLGRVAGGVVWIAGPTAG